ncbi:hypothetical protein QTO34_019568, partial [Cnephaeus nilssonii]
MNAELKTQMEELKQKWQQLILMLNQHHPNCIIRTDSVKTPNSRRKPTAEAAGEQVTMGWKEERRGGAGDKEREEEEGPSAETKVVLRGACSTWGQACRRQDRGSGPERRPTRHLWALLQPLRQGTHPKDLRAARKSHEFLEPDPDPDLILMQGWRRAQCQALLYPPTVVQLSPSWRGSQGASSLALLELLWARGTGALPKHILTE